MMTMDCLKASVTSLIFPRVAEFNKHSSRQIYLQINFQQEFSIMGGFGQSVQLRKQISNPLEYPTFEAFFYVFMAKMNEKIYLMYIEASALKRYIF